MGGGKIPSAEFGVDQLRGLASAEGQILPFPIDFDGRPYNTLTLPCERVINDNTSCYRDDGDRCLAPEARRHTIGRCHVAQRVGNCVFRRLEKILYFMTHVKVAPPPELLGQDFVINFATYMRVYMVNLAK